MPLDIFICGTCLISFNDIEQFIFHKNDLCGKVDESENTHVPMEMETPITISSVASVIKDENIHMVDQGDNSGTTINLPGSEALLTSAGDIFQGDNQQTVIILQGNLPSLNLENAGQLLNEASMETLASLYQKKKGRPGRPRKSLEKKIQKKQSTTEIKEKNIPEIGSDGKFLCKRCNKSFTRERVFNAHKCLALSEYVDFSNKEPLMEDPDNSHMPHDDIDDDGALDHDTTDSEFKLPHIVKKQDNKSTKISDKDVISTTKGDIDNIKGIANQAQEETTDIERDSGNHEERGKNLKQDHSVNEMDSNFERELAVEVDGGPDTSEKHPGKGHLGNVPIFLSDSDRIAFENCLNVDLSGMDNMFRVHCIEQELNQNVSQLSRLANNQLSLYSCNTCNKFFKSLSHMRFHVLIHTDLRPFRCFKCDFASNARGNLYTHMRKHTGQFYRCGNCDFKTVNKGHLIEHQFTHSDEKRQCALCKKYYNTQKSLVSHIRRYHDTPKGRDYLATFMQTRETSGSIVIHQCQICNRKFKKKLDRDRHLFMHDIKDLPIIQHCQLCDYSVSRPKYLEKHFQQHRCIYKCCKCKAMFLSSTRLVEHLTTTHVEPQDTYSWEKLFEDSVATSLYLPEPDDILSQEEKDLVNLPAKLSQTGLHEMKLCNSGEDDMSSTLMNAADIFVNKLPAVTVQKNNEDNESDTFESDTVKSAQDNDIIVENNMKTSADSNDIVTQSQKALDKQVSTENIHESEIVSNHNCNADYESLGKDSDINLVNTKSDNGDKAENKLLIGLNGNDDRDDHEEAEQSFVEETNLTDEDLLGIKYNTVEVKQLIQKLGYLKMTLRIFQKMRDTFGNEECEFCGRLFFSRVDYEPHVRTHTGDKPHLCQKCGFKAITRNNLKCHIDKEHDNTTYPCRECQYIAFTRTQLWNHSMKHKGLKLRLRCPLCLEQFEMMIDLKAHATLVHPDANMKELEKIITQRHKNQGKLGRRSYKCPHCDKVFFRASSELQKHMWIHEGIKPYKCSLCSHACRSKNNLQAHMLRHSKVKPFSCGDCGKAYKSKTALRWHTRSHASGKIFKCEKCNYEGTQSNHLKRHMETHEVIKKFTCSVCDFSANTIGYLRIHYTRFHKGVNTDHLESLNSGTFQVMQLKMNAFKCLSCDFLFGNLSDLKHHLCTRHHLNVQAIQSIENIGGGHGNISEVKIVEVVSNQQTNACDQNDPGSMALEDLSGVEYHMIIEETLDDKTASAVSFLQQIMGMSENSGTLTQNADGNYVLQVNPGTIIVQEDGSEMNISSNTGKIDGNQYVIQYIPQQEEAVDVRMGMIEVQSEEVEAQVMTE